MTGFGKAETLFNGKKIHVEIKSLNSKTLDLNTRIAALYREHELEIRALIAEKLLRVNLNFYYPVACAGNGNGGNAVYRFEFVLNIVLDKLFGLNGVHTLIAYAHHSGGHH